jgi:hypothetical protein
MEPTGQSQSQLSERAFWSRALHMVLFAIAYTIAEFVIVLLVVVQFITILVTGRANEPLLRFGNSLSTYVRQILRFVLYNTETMPFPFSDWPDEPADGERWRGFAGNNGRAAADAAMDEPSFGREPSDAPIDAQDLRPG